MSTLYNLFRREGAPTQYGPNKTPVTQDVLLIGLAYSGLAVLFSLLVILPSYKGKQALYYFLRVFLGVFVITSIVVCNYGQGWHVANITTKTPYRPSIPDVIEADISVQIGLHSFNITLRGRPTVVKLSTYSQEETINYNERISWDFSVGHGNFGSSDSRINIELRAAKEAGLPTAILRIAEYFSFDGGDFRWGRFYQQAGFFSHALLWAAFPFWCITVVALHMVPVYGIYCCWLTGFTILAANVVFASYQNPRPLEISFDDKLLTFSYGWSFILCAVTGVLCCLIALILMFLNDKDPEAVLEFFDIDPGIDAVAEEEDEVTSRYGSSDEESEDTINDEIRRHTNIHVVNFDDPGEGGPGEHEKPRIRHLRRRGTVLQSIKNSLKRNQSHDPSRHASSSVRLKVHRPLHQMESDAITNLEKNRIALEERSPSLFKSKKKFNSDSGLELEGVHQKDSAQNNNLQVPGSSQKLLTRALSSPSGNSEQKVSIGQKTSLPLVLEQEYENASKGETSRSGNTERSDEEGASHLGVDNIGFVEHENSLETGNVYEDISEL